MRINFRFLLAALLLTSSRARAQQPARIQTAPAESPVLSFEVATIKPAAPSPDGHVHINHPAGDRFSAQNITLLALLDWAYSLPQTQILDAPPWLGSTRFDLQAKLAAADAPTNLSENEDQARRRRMVQTLLAERCNLRAHEEARLLPAYDLVVAKGGPKLLTSTTGGLSISTGTNHLSGQGMTSAMIAEQLSYAAGRIVVDKTSLPARYDLKLRWTPDGAALTDNAPPFLFTAIQEQLGLKLDSAKEPVEVLVIDHIDQPSAN